ncbi:MAG: DeoR/GlpR transcriptional regulator [Spirochaetales bacterium]|nr:MAG: DeoR/GlpR transcriptional regulator [Spirochaetales bacterium]
MDVIQSRLKNIIDTLKIHRAVTIKEFAQHLHVSEMTIRRDVAILVKENMVKQVHGVIVYNDNRIDTPATNDEGSRYNLPNEEERRVKEKRSIAKMAASLISPNDIIIIDTGSTTEFLGEYIPGDLPLKIICFAINILLSVHKKKDCSLIFGGGYFHENTMMFESAEGVELIKKNRANKAFMSARGVSDTLGITTADNYEIATKRAILNSSQEKILLVDSSKFNVVRSAYYAELKDFDVIVTDDKIPEEYVRIIRDMGITLHIT